MTIVSRKEAQTLLGPTGYATLLGLGHHHADDYGNPYWLGEEWDDLVGLVDSERKLFEGVKQERLPGGESQEPFASDSGQRGCNLLACDRHQLELDTDAQS